MREAKGSAKVGTVLAKADTPAITEKGRNLTGRGLPGNGIQAYRGAA